MTRSLKLTLAYDGTAYAGWQRQSRGTTVQAALEDALASVVGERCAVVGAGRTDAGVHAAGQVASLSTTSPIACDALVRALNVHLPLDIRVCGVEEAPVGFDARRAARVKTYRYAIWNGAEPGPFLRHVVWHVPYALDVARMQAAAARIVGEHDFAAFQGRGAHVRTTTRRVLASNLDEMDLDRDHPVPHTPIGPGRESRLLRYEVAATGFLRHMVRAIVGSLVDVGRGRWPVEEMDAIMASRDRARAGQTAPPQGLMLWRVDY